METIFERLSNKPIIVTDAEDFKQTTEKTEKQIRYPYSCCREDSSYLQAPIIAVQSTKGEKTIFNMKPQTKIVREEQRIKKQTYVDEREVMLFVSSYTPMLKVTNAIISDDIGYKSLIEAVERGILEHFAEEVVDECEKLPEYEELPRTFKKLPPELKKVVEKRAIKFVNKFDAFEVRVRKNSIFMILPEITEEVPSVSNTIYFYKFSSRSDKETVSRLIEFHSSRVEKVKEDR